MISFQFVRDNFEELEADFQREYGIDLRSALYGDDPIGGRRLTALIEGLSPESKTYRKIAYPDGHKWGHVEELLATLVELVDTTNRLIYATNADKKSPKVWEPLHVPRPYDKKKGPSSTEDMLSFFGTMAVSEHVVVEAPQEIES